MTEKMLQIYSGLVFLSINSSNILHYAFSKSASNHSYNKHGRHGVSLSARSSTSVPRWPSHFSLWWRFSAPSPFHQPTTTSRTSLPSWHVRPSSFRDC